jgi:hypothetical protein
MIDASLQADARRSVVVVSVVVDALVGEIGI